MLTKFDGDIVIARAYQTQSGYIARYITLSTCWSLLLPDGKVEGTRLVKGWKPYSGWTFLEDVFMTTRIRREAEAREADPQ